MISAKSTVMCALIALLVSGCGIAARPEAGTLSARSGIYNQQAYQSGFKRPARVNCLKQHHLPAHLYRTADKLPAIRVGSGPSAPTMIFEPFGWSTPDLKIRGEAQGAEIIGTVLLYPNGMSLSEAKIVEQCAAIGVA